MKGTIDAVGEAHLAALKVHMEVTAKKLGESPAKIQWTDLEQKAAKIVPKQTSKVTEGGYREYRTLISAVPKEELDKFPYRRMDIANTTELACLVNGERSALGIKHMLDAQYQRTSKLQAVINYLEILKLAGLVEF